MGLKVIRDFQHGDHIVLRLEFDGAINLAGNTFNVTFTSNLNLETPEYDVDFEANTNLHPDDVIGSGVINLVIDTTDLVPNNYLYSITRTDADSALTTLARSGLHSVDMVESKKRL